MMASEDITFEHKQTLIKANLGSDSLHSLLIAVLEMGHSLYVTPTTAVITTRSPRKTFEADFAPATQSTILRHLLIDVLWEAYRGED